MSENSSVEIETSEQLNKVITENLQEYIDDNVAEEDKEKAAEEFDIIIHGFLNGKMKPEDLGGIIAVRGFVYQYYVALYYILEMISKPDKWKCLIYELGDDITLIGCKDIMFIQVKTEKEDDAPHNLTPSTLYNRDKGINSWLDKLFRNLNKINEKVNYAGYQEDVTESMNVHFVLATNMGYDSNKILAPYSDKDKAKHEDDKIAEDLSKSIKDKNNDILNFNDFVDKDPSWCLDRFSINHCGRSEYLWIKIRERLINITNCDDHEIARRILDKLLTTVLKRTSNDNVQEAEERKKFIFYRDEVIDLIDKYKQEASLEIYNRMQSGLIKHHFEECIISIQNSINQQWKGSFRHKFSETLLWLKENLELLENTDEFIYERFLNRVFLLENSRCISTDLNDPDTKGFLISSLKNIIFYMAFYNDRSIVGDKNSKFFIKQGKDSSNDKRLFTIYNGKNNETFSMCTRRVIDKIDDCPFTRSIRDEIFCFLTNDKDDQDESTLGLFFPGFSPIVKEKEKIKITHKHVKVKFYRYKKVQQFKDALKLVSDREEVLEFLEEPYILEGWQNLIANNEMGGQNGD
ncbi:dsDNA nuclease domain-containing protein [Candidatus Clostridium radicumherbarum]|uniref:DsDNA nuclease domain-containing protein n=1 Tax=Candidatus Clostridium radicumherbarum TaxID=3381662 RepID=A0ABW8TWM5_9CLOT